MTTIAKENLDERIERIKKRNEEIEKKYREAEEDRLMALKDNAMVEIKPPKDEDWPKAHKYDKIDFTYDVKPEKLEELNKQKYDEINIKNNKRDYYKKFADGEGPPPDPAYNFLADAERDGTTISHKNDTNKKDSRQNNNNVGGNKNNKDYNQQQQQQQQNKRGTLNNGSFRGRGNHNNGKNNNFKNQKQNSQPEYEQWRNEREKIDEARINRQKIGDGKWKREWDNDKLNADNEALSRLDKAAIGSGDAFSNTAAVLNLKKSPTHNGYNYHNGGGLKMVKRQNSGSNFKTATDCLVEKRGNITVSVTQTGEVKSVKLTSTPAIGTGRVGPRQISKPQFQIQTVEREVTIQQTPLSPRAQNKNPTRSNTTSNNAMVVSNQINLPQKVPNKSNVIIDSTLNTPSNINSEKNKKNKKHSPKQSSGGHQDNVLKQPIKSVVNPVAGYQPITQQIQNVTPNLVSNIGTNKLPTVSLFNDNTSSSQSPSIIQSSLSGNEIPTSIVVDLSHKPEFQKRSIQDRLLRARQVNNSNSGNIVNNSGNVSMECKNELLEIINENNPNERSIDKKSIESDNEIKNDNANISSNVIANSINEEKIALKNQKIENCDNTLLSEPVSSSSASQFSVETSTTAVIVCK